LVIERRFDTVRVCENAKLNPAISRCVQLDRVFKLRHHAALKQDALGAHPAAGQFIPMHAVPLAQVEHNAAIVV
jgi:hypothetical protein